MAAKKKNKEQTEVVEVINDTTVNSTELVSEGKDETPEVLFDDTEVEEELIPDVVSDEVNKTLEEEESKVCESESPLYEEQESKYPEVRFINNSKYEQLTRKFDTDSGYDIRADMDIPSKLIMTGTVFAVSTKLFLELPEGYEAQIRPRSGLGMKGLTVVNAPGTIDEHYVGEIKVIVTNLSNDPMQIHNGDRIAQVVFVKKDPVVLAKVTEISETDRGTGGFGHTGDK